ncbi:MAG TPA: Hpt domain-containing protein [Candidatus Limnocylindrales bacterium]|nr:Hpt domain-containing protein [Candidatus Limnocylindrales bacterium]
MSSGPIDQDAFDRLVEMTGGELDFVDELVDTYIEDGRNQVDGLRAALERGDSEAVVRAAHSLKSSSVNVGAVALGDRCRTLEEAARGGPVDDAAAQVTSIAADFDAVVAALLDARATRPA